MATSLSQKHKSLERSLLAYERGNHAHWVDSAAPYNEGNEAPLTAPGEHALKVRLNCVLDAAWQRRLDRTHTEDNMDRTQTQARDMILYKQCVLPNKTKVGCLGQYKDGNNPRSTAFIMYYAARNNPRGVTSTRLSFGSVEHFFEDPEDGSAWAGVLRWRQVQPAAELGRPPYPRRTVDDDSRIEWIQISLIVDLVGVAKVYKREGSALHCQLYVVNKRSWSELDQPIPTALLGPHLSSSY